MEPIRSRERHRGRKKKHLSVVGMAIVRGLIHCLYGRAWVSLNTNQRGEKRLETILPYHTGYTLKYVGRPKKGNVLYQKKDSVKYGVTEVPEPLNHARGLAGTSPTLAEIHQRRPKDP